MLDVVGVGGVPAGIAPGLLAGLVLVIVGRRAIGGYEVSQQRYEATDGGNSS